MAKDRIEGGYILQPRIIQESDISKAPPYVREIWSYLLREANSRDVKYGGNVIKRGQLFVDYKTIREDLSWYVGYRKESYNENHTKKAMAFLRETGRITTEKELGGVLITVCNYEFYQNPKNYERTNESTTDGTNEEPMKNHTPPDNNKKDKKDKKEKEKRINNILLSQVDASTFDEKEKKYYEIAISFWELIKNNLLKADITTSTVDNADCNKWINPIRLLMEKDGRSLNEIREVWGFLKDDDFWGENIRSTAKLRKKNRDGETYFEVLLIKSRNAGKRKEKPGQHRNIQNSGVSEDYERSILERLRSSGSSETMQES